MRVETVLLSDETRPHWADADARRPIRATVWMPEEWAAQAAPVVLLSHGTGGEASDLAWLAQALCAEGFVVASVDSIPSSAMQEDHVSMGWAAARKLRRSVDGLGRVLAIELLTAARGLALRAPLQPGAATGAVVELVNAASGGPGQDRYLSPEIEAVVALVQSGRVLAAASAETGPLA